MPEAIIEEAGDKPPPYGLFAGSPPNPTLLAPEKVGQAGDKPPPYGLFARSPPNPTLLAPEKVGRGFSPRRAGSDGGPAGDKPSPYGLFAGCLDPSKESKLHGG